MNYQYFIGLELPESVIKPILKYQSKHFYEDLHFKPIVPHITLIPPGPLSNVSPMYIRPKIKQITQLPISIQLTKVDNFNETVLYLGVSSKYLNTLHQNIVDLLPQNTKSIYYIGKNIFTPHITILQSKNNTKFSKNQLNECSDTFKNFNGLNIDINYVSLFNKNGPRLYTPKQII